LPSLVVVAVSIFMVATLQEMIEDKVPKVITQPPAGVLVAAKMLACEDLSQGSGLIDVT
jgi:hypothetical protein